MTEIPEHLLSRSKQRRAALSGDGDAGESAASAPGESATPATTTQDVAQATPTAPAPVTEKAPEPTPPWVEAALTRKKVPWWAAGALAILPFFFIAYAWTLSEPSGGEGPLALGGEQFAVTCAGCHGTGGGGGVGPALSGGAVLETFPTPAEQVTWVSLGSAGYKDHGLDTYGALNKPIKGGMPGQVGNLDAEQIMDVILYERTEFGGEQFDIATWEDGFEKQLTELIPDQTPDFMAVLEQWQTTPPIP